MSRGRSARAVLLSLGLLLVAATTAQADLGYVSSFGSAGSGNGQFGANSPSRLALGSNLYVTDPGNVRVQTFNPSDGTYIDHWGHTGTGAFSHPAGIAFDAMNGIIYVSDLNNNVVEEWDPSTSPPNSMGSFGSSGSGNGQLSLPTGIALSADGSQLFVADQGNHRIVQFAMVNGSATFVRNITPSTGSALSAPTDVAYDGSNIWVADPPTNRVLKLSLSGTVLASAGVALNGPQGLALGESGNLFVTDTNDNQVYELDSNGNQVGVISSLGAGGAFNHPVGVTANTSGDVWVADRGNSRVVRLTTHATPPPPPDTDAPRIAIDTPTDGATYSLNQAPAANFSCSDDDGISSCRGFVQQPDGSSVETGNGGSLPSSVAGGYSLTVTAVDKAGNRTHDSRSYTVTLPPVPQVAPGCANSVTFSVITVTGGCLRRVGLTWEATGQVSLNGIKLTPTTGDAKVIIDPLNLRIAAQGHVLVQIGPITIAGQRLGPFTLYEGSFDWVFQGQIPGLPDLGSLGSDVGVPTDPNAPAAGVNLPALPGFVGFLPLPDLPSVQLPDFGNITAGVRDTLAHAVPGIDGANVRFPTSLVPQIPPPCIGVTPENGAAFLSLPISGQLCVGLVSGGAQIDASVGLPSLGWTGVLQSVSAATRIFVGADGSIGLGALHFGMQGDLMLGPLDIQNVAVDYDRSSDSWGIAGGASLLASGFGLSGHVTVTHGHLSAFGATASLGAGIPLGPQPVVWLNKLGFDGQLPPQARFGGIVGLGVGPSLFGLNALQIDGHGGYVFPTTVGDRENPGYMYLDGQAKLGNLLELAHGGFQVFTDSFPFHNDATGHIGLSAAGFNVGVDGKVLFDQSDFDGELSGHLGGYGFSADASAVVSSSGIAACATARFVGLFDIGLGVGYSWGDDFPGGVQAMGNSCDIGPWRTSVTAAGARAATVGTPIVVRGHTKLQVVAVAGVGGPPAIALTSPSGERLLAPADTRTSTHTASALIFRDPANRTTYAILGHPRAGIWRLSLQPGSPAVARVLTATALPAPRIHARVRGSGRRRTLVYRIAPLAGQRVAFVERVGEVTKRIGVAAGRRGRLRFDLAPGPAGARTVVALVSENGKPRRTMVVAHFRAPDTTLPARPARGSAVRRGSDLVVRWRPGAGDSRYLVTAAYDRGRTSTVVTTSLTATFKDLFGSSAAALTVAGVRPDGRPGPALRISLAPLPPPCGVRSAALAPKVTKRNASAARTTRRRARRHKTRRRTCSAAR